MLFTRLLINPASTVSGEAIFTTPSLVGVDFTVPNGVYFISAVVIGGGGGSILTGRGQGTDFNGWHPGGGGGELRWVNNIRVNPGEVIRVFVGLGGAGLTLDSSFARRRAGSGTASKLVRVSDGSTLVQANGGKGGLGISGGTWGGTPGAGGQGGIGEGGGNGGNGGGEGIPFPGGRVPAAYATGGGGAGGYGGTGGTGGYVYSSNDSGTTQAFRMYVNGTAGVGGAGGGGGACWGGGVAFGSYGNAYSGGGVGLYGQGTDGIAGISGNSNVNDRAGGGGSAGGAGLRTGGLYGAGGAAYTLNTGYTLMPSQTATTGTLSTIEGFDGLETRAPGCSATGAMGIQGAVRIIWGPNRSFPLNAAN